MTAPRRATRAVIGFCWASHTQNSRRPTFFINGLDTITEGIIGNRRAGILQTERFDSCKI